MSDIRIIFSPHTASPRFLDAVLVAAAEAQRQVAMAVLEAQIQVLETMVAAQMTFVHSVWRASLVRS